MLEKRIDKFERVCREVGADVNAFPQAKFIQSLCDDGHGDFKEMMYRFVVSRLERGDYSNWEGWEYRSDWAEQTYLDLPNKRWRLEPCTSIAVLGEQGIGDELLFSTCLPDLTKMVGQVVVECDPRLMGVLSRLWHVSTRPRTDLSLKRPEDYFIPMGDLPRLFRKKKEDFPKSSILCAKPEMVEKWKHLKGMTGLAWRGRRGKHKPQDFGLKNPVCLQYDAWDYETEGMIVPDCDLKNDIEDILGILANLERVVTVPQTIVHLAGISGVKVDVIIPPVSSGRVIDAWQWGYGLGSKMDWYDSVTVYQSLKAFCASSL